MYQLKKTYMREDEKKISDQVFTISYVIIYFSSFF